MIRQSSFNNNNFSSNLFSKNTVYFGRLTRPIGALLAVTLIGSVLVGCSSTPPQTRPVVARSIPTYHVVQSGDTLIKIANRYGLDYRRVAALNGLDSNYTIRLGQKLRLTANNQAYIQPVVTRPTVATRPPVYQKPNYTTAPAIATPLPSQRWLSPVRGSLLRPFDTENNIIGNWYAASQGSPVVATQAGTVMYVGSDLPEYGKLVMIQHSKDIISAYAHLDSFNVQEKQTIQAGQQIGTVGFIPALKQPALEFQIRYRGTPINPTTYVK